MQGLLLPRLRLRQLGSGHIPQSTGVYLQLCEKRKG